MGYSIFIGNAELETSWSAEEGGWARWHVAEHSEDNAPNFIGDDLTSNSNGRHPSYSQWDDFCHTVKLHSLFFNKENGLMQEHPGIVPLTTSILEAVRNTREKYTNLYPNAKPGWGDGYDYTLARLLWLEWWMDWALHNCERPAISNS
jgi:hypothetical protein